MGDGLHTMQMTTEPPLSFTPQRPPTATPEAFVRAHQAMVWRYLRLLGAQPADAEDLTQETFLRCLARHAPEALHATAPGLLRTIARGLWLDQQRWFRRRRAREQADHVDQLVAQGLESGLEDRWLAALRGCRSGLTERARRGLDLFYRDQLGRAAVAEDLGMTSHGVRNLLVRTRQTLRECIERRMMAGGER